LSRLLLRNEGTRERVLRPLAQRNYYCVSHHRKGEQQRVMAPSGDRFYHDRSPEFTSISRRKRLLGDEAFIGGELYISKALESRLQVSKTSIFPQFYRHYVRAACTVSERFAALIVLAAQASTGTPIGCISRRNSGAIAQSVQSPALSFAVAELRRALILCPEETTLGSEATDVGSKTSLPMEGKNVRADPV
jgi:hypothetical protein